MPGDGSASPVVWGDRLFVLTAVPAGPGEGSGGGFFTRLRRRIMGTVGTGEHLQFMVLALDRRDGSVVWERTAVTEQPHEGRHGTGSWASASAVTDGEVVCAFFGSRGLYCYDLDGELLWERDLGDMRIRMGFGEGASPALHGDSLVVVWDHEGQSFITALDKRTGDGALAHGSRRDDLLVDAARRRGAGRAAGRDERHRRRPQLRPRDGPAGLGGRGSAPSTPSRRRSPPAGSST